MSILQQNEIVLGRSSSNRFNLMTNCLKIAVGAPLAWVILETRSTPERAEDGDLRYEESRFKHEGIVGAEHRHNEVERFAVVLEKGRSQKRTVELGILRRRGDRVRSAPLSP